MKKQQQHNLTRKQELFCNEYLVTGNASEAYRRVYSAAAMKPETVNRAAKALLDNSKIATRLDTLRKPATSRAQVTLETHLNDLLTLREAAMLADNFNAAITAEVNRGKAAGLYDTRLLHRRDTAGTTALLLQKVLDGDLTEREAGYLIEIQGIPLPEILKIGLTRQTDSALDEILGKSSDDLDAKYQAAIENKEMEKAEFLPDRAAEVKALKDSLQSDITFIEIE